MVELDLDTELDMHFEIEEHIDPPDNWSKCYGSNNTCKLFLIGACRKGKKCIFRHTKEDRTVVCKHWLRGLCKKNENCEFLHRYDLSRMPECFFFSKYGECSNEDCIYLHVDQGKKAENCPWYERGFCKRGGDCRLRHLKTQICEDYLRGFCPKGKECSFGHPRFEIPPMDKSFVSLPCHLCGQMGHKATKCKMATNYAPQQLRNSVSCLNCGQAGHYASVCPIITRC